MCHSFAIRQMHKHIAHTALSRCGADCAVQLGLLFSISRKRLNECAVNFFLLCTCTGICVCSDARVIMFCLFAVAVFSCFYFVRKCTHLDLLRSIVWFQRKLLRLMFMLVCHGMHTYQPYWVCALWIRPIHFFSREWKFWGAHRSVYWFMQSLKTITLRWNWSQKLLESALSNDFFL